jgi:zinc transport system permease protein
MEFFSFLQYAFIQKALIAGLFVGMVCAILGIFLVLKNMSMIGDGLSHVSFGAVAFALFLGVLPMYVAVPVAIIGAFFILKINQVARVYGDAAIGMVSSVGIAAGVLFSNLAKGFNVDLFSYLFGNILAISRMEVWLAVGLSCLVGITIALLYYDFYVSTFDAEYARVSGVKTGQIDVWLAVLTAVTVVLAIRVVGVMLVSALLIFPAVTALQLARGLKRAIVLAVAITSGAVIAGIFSSFYFNLPSGATIVLYNFLAFLIAVGYKKL